MEVAGRRICQAVADWQAKRPAALPMVEMVEPHLGRTHKKQIQVPMPLDMEAAEVVAQRMIQAEVVPTAETGIKELFM